MDITPQFDMPKRITVQSADSAAVYKPIKALDPETARKIAAGEVIDRPAAVIRNPNAVDTAT